MRYKRWVISAVSVLALGTIALAVADPLLIKSILAKYRSTDHFLVLQEDIRIRYEELAGPNAEAVAEVLSEARTDVEALLHAAFQEPIQVFVCTSQASFNQYVPLSRNARGAAMWGKVFLSPGAFERGSLSGLVTHELTHVLFNSHLGNRAHIANVPLWFREGIANYVANGGPAYTAERELKYQVNAPVRRALISGEIDYWFESDDPKDAVTAGGVANPILYSASTAFVHFIQESNPTALDALVQALLSGERFDAAFLNAFQKSKDSMLTAFADYLSD